MKGSQTLHYLAVFSMITPTSSASATCGMFHFLSPSIQNGTLVVKENTTLNITFSVLNKHCSTVPFGVLTIDISLRDTNKSMFARQCTIHKTCTNGLEHANTSCQCLGTQGIYGFQLVVQRQHSTKWKWSTSNITTNDTFIHLNVTYPPQVMDMKLVSSDFPVPKDENVTVLCKWQNGNPPSRVILLDRQSNLLAMGNNSGNIHYTFSSVKCNESGILRCEAERSDNNMSVTLLVQCPPEIVIPLPKRLDVFVGQETHVTFPFHSHTSQITCDMIQVNQNRTTDSTYLLKTLTENIESESTLRKESCLHNVTGIPPDLHITIKFRNLTLTDFGLWRVNISNYRGSDVMLIQVHVMESLIPTSAIATEMYGNVIVPVSRTAEESKSYNILVSMAGVGAAVIVFILIHIGISFRNRGCTVRYLRRMKALFDQSVHDVYAEIGDKTVQDSQLPGNRKSPETDFTRSVLCQRTRSVPEVVQSGALLPIRTISLSKRGTYNEYYDSDVRTK